MRLDVLCKNKFQVLNDSLMKYNLLIFFTDPPEISVEKSWIHSGEGFEAQLVCIVHADPQPTVSLNKLITKNNI